MAFERSSSEDEPTATRVSSTSVGSNNGSQKTSSIGCNLNPLARDFSPSHKKVDSRISTELFETVNGVSGLFARVNIKRGTQILCEDPLMQIASEDQLPLVWNLYERLSKEKKASFDSLQSYHRTSMEYKTVSRLVLPFTNDELALAERNRVLATFGRNSFIACPPSLAVFEVAAHLTHSCVPNVHHSFNTALNKHTVYAIADIDAGEQLTTSFLGGEHICLSSAQRTEVLQQNYGITCACAACNDRTGVSDNRRQVMNTVAEELQAYHEGRTSVTATEAQGLALVFLGLLEVEGLTGMDMAVATRHISTIALDLENWNYALQYAAQEQEIESYCLGTTVGSPEGGGMTAAEWTDYVRCVVYNNGGVAELGGSVPSRNTLRKWKKRNAKAKARINALSACADQNGVQHETLHHQKANAKSKPKASVKQDSLWDEYDNAFPKMGAE
ncbi:hypothetical protein K470DRAFT_11198 [Piedraia hortae CBS 480.64]|uniref:SET domain-containing protein n=1 Tax=Piedraia hortae CBS 480.64 TaxID=1314780 RepID=A0A6A7C504_9PEZI|nr:hypothetical protein K470DRAFT_11198 [Piedraia hortae CBS 480.64]